MLLNYWTTGCPEYKQEKQGYKQQEQLAEQEQTAETAQNKIN